MLPLSLKKSDFFLYHFLRAKMGLQPGICWAVPSSRTSSHIQAASPMRGRCILIIDRSQLLMISGLAALSAPQSRAEQSKTQQSRSFFSWCPLSRIVCVWPLIIHNAPEGEKNPRNNAFRARGLAKKRGNLINWRNSPPRVTDQICFHSGSRALSSKQIWLIGLNCVTWLHHHK